MNKLYGFLLILILIIILILFSATIVREGISVIIGLIILDENHLGKTWTVISLPITAVEKDENEFLIVSTFSHHCDNLLKPRKKISFNIKKDKLVNKNI
jgi:hypothetical protein